MDKTLALIKVIVNTPMPFTSIAQMMYLREHHPEIAKRWSKETPNVRSLPMHVSKKKAKPIKKKGW